jgi:predicted nucleotidyltransferase
MSASAVLPAMVERIVNHFAPMQIILFGSQARGDARDDSDIDLLIVLEQAESKRKAAVAIRRDLIGFPGAIDIVVTTPSEVARRGCFNGSVLQPALEEGKVLYDRP